MGLVRAFGTLLLAVPVGLATAGPEEVAPLIPRATAPDAARSLAAFQQVARVFQSPRCQNCHPIGDRPRRGDRGLVHAQNIQRGLEALGASCSTCHQTRNVEVPGGPPGAPHWGLPPPTAPMVFEGRSPGELCRQLKDPTQTGGRSLDALVHHVASDPLVAWGWAPGPGRTPPPISQAELVDALTTWVREGAACPD